MGRKSKTTEEKKCKLSVTISTDNYNKLVDGDMNKSQLINWLLGQYFNSLKNEK